MNIAEIKEKLYNGNKRYVESGRYEGDVSASMRLVNANAQTPYAVVITCSDSRVIPEVVFDASLGDLFVIRVAGNVMDKHQLGSVEYAVEHLEVKYVLVLGHTGCGAVNAALSHDPEGYVRHITNEIKLAIKNEKDPKKACCLNAKRSAYLIKKHLSHYDLTVKSAVYDILSGEVTFSND